MSFSNADVGDKPADPQTTKAKADATLNEKITHLNKLTDSCKFAMMTTKESSSNMLVSRCMAIGAKVRPGPGSAFPAALA